MRILMVNYSEVKSPGGVHKTIIEVAKYLSVSDHEVTVLQGNPMGFRETEIHEGFKIIRVKSKIASYLYDFSPEIYFYLKKHFKELNPDIVHVHGYHTLFSPEVIYLIFKIDSKVPIVFSPHFGFSSRTTFGGKYLWEPYNKLIGTKIINYCDIIITASLFESEDLEQTFNLSKEKIKIIPHGVNFINSKIAKNANGKINLLYVGYLLKIKGVQYIIEALQDLYYKKNLEVSLTIIGEGPYEKELKKLAESLNVNQFIQWEGFIPPSQTEKLRMFYLNSDVLLLLSQSENYGVVVAESLALGTPVIVSKTTALKEFLSEPGCFGVNYPPNPKEVADLIMKVYENNGVIGPFSDKIRTWNEVVEDYETNLLKFIERKLIMHIKNPLQMNDWQIKSFLLVILAIQGFLLVLVGLDAIKIQIPILRQLISFIFLTFIPGILILRILRIHDIGNVKTVLYSVGLSIGALMLIGLLMNTFYPFLGIENPISFFSLYITINLVILLFYALAYFRDKNYFKPTFFDTKEVLSPYFLLLCLLPFLAIFGTYMLNQYGNNTLQMILLLIIAIFPLIHIKMDSKKIVFFSNFCYINLHFIPYDFDQSVHLGC